MKCKFMWFNKVVIEQHIKIEQEKLGFISMGYQLF